MGNTDANRQKIFVSYSRKDGEEHAFRLAGDLRAAGANVWMDQLDIEPGAPWDLEVEKALNAADCVLFIVTQKAVASGNVLNEVYYALDENKRILPAVFHECSFPFQLRRLQRIDFIRDYTDGLLRLKKALGLARDAPYQDQRNAADSDEAGNATMRTGKGERPSLTDDGAYTDGRDEAGEDKARPPLTDAGGRTRNRIWLAGGIAAAAILLVFVLRNTPATDKPARGDVLLMGSERSKSNSDSSGPPSEMSSEKNEPAAKTARSSAKLPEKKPSLTPEDDQAIEDRYSQLNFNATKLMVDGKYKEAIPEFAKALKVRDNPNAFFSLGRCYAAIGDDQMAIKAFTEAIARRKSWMYFNARGLAYKNSDKLKEALTDFDEAVILGSKNAPPFFNRGLVKQALQDNDGACKDFLVAAEMRHAEAEKAYANFCKKRGD